jgi:threonine/homoserine/homoserine lactone efflux protein
MGASITIYSTLALFAATAALAAMPSASVLAVSAKSASSGFKHGVFTAAGIVLGDIVFILLALFGLALLVEATGTAFVLVKYVGGIYLLWLSALIWRSRKQQAQHKSGNSSSRLSSFMAGLLITLGDQKAVLFYLGFLPAFLNLSTLTASDVAIIVGVTVVAVGGVKLAYAYAAVKAGQVFGSRLSEAMNILAASVMFVAGVWVIARA